ncbi:MAG: hypothetical protein L3J98_17255 [Gammaproteobacteria bacterium]|nr:hypothetical protein [Gammaproteobacteria bacterium]
MTLWVNVLVIVIAVFVMIITASSLAGEYRRKLEKVALLEKISNASPAGRVIKVDYASLENLPLPVQNYFRHVLPNGQPFIKTTWLEQVGQLKLTPKSKGWSTFKATQFIWQDTVSFLWDAKINITPLFYVRVRDSLIEAIGEGNVYLMSALSIGSDKDKPELNSGALYRYLAEAVWHPTALLPQSGVIWEPVSENKAIAHFTKFNISVSIEFTFNNVGEIIGIYTVDRYGKFENKYIKYPWEGQFSDYKEFDGIKIPTKGEVGWHLPDGWWLFWKGEIIDAKFVSSDL